MFYVICNLHVEQQFMVFSDTECLRNKPKSKVLGKTYLVIPEWCENKIHLNEDAAKWQQSSHKRHHGWGEIPFFLGDWTRNGLYTTGIIGSTTPVPTNNSAKKCQRERDESPNDKNNNHRAKWNSS